MLVFETNVDEAVHIIKTRDFPRNAIWSQRRTGEKQVMFTLNVFDFDRVLGLCFDSTNPFNSESGKIMTLHELSHYNNDHDHNQNHQYQRVKDDNDVFFLDHKTKRIIGDEDLQIVFAKKVYVNTWITVSCQDEYRQEFVNSFSIDNYWRVFSVRYEESFTPLLDTSFPSPPPPQMIDDDQLPTLQGEIVR